MIRKLLSCVGEYKKDSILTPILVFLEVVLEVLIPFMMAYIIDLGIPQKDIGFIATIGSVMIVMAFFSLYFGARSAQSSAIASCGFAKNVRKRIFYKIQDFSFANIDKYSTSSLVTRLTTDINNVQMAYQTVIRMLVRAPFMFTLSLVMAFSINVKLSLVFVAVTPLLALVLFFILTKAFPNFKKMFKKYDILNRTVQENLTGIRVVKAYVREDHEIEKFSDATEELYRYSKKAEKIIAFNMPAMQLAIYACIILVCWFGAGFVVSKELTTGQLTTFLTYITQILVSLMMVSMSFVMLVISKASIDRIEEVIDEVPTIQGSESDLVPSDGSIEFKNVSFSYTNDEKLSLENINLKIKSGETIGIIGGTGSSKTTLVQMIPRLFDTKTGDVFVGGHNVKDYNLVTLRDNVAMVLQKNTLFSGTIKENLLWGDENATDEEIVLACKHAQADSFIRSFPKGYETELGQGGVNVSGGQKQRLCIARALIKKPKILILDDSTSAVDTKTDSLIRKALRSDLPSSTKIIIAQRIASVEDADKIIIMDNGKISAIGTNDELMASSNIYRDIYESQKKGAEDNE